MTAFLRRTLVGGLLVVVVFSSIAYVLWLAFTWSRTGLGQVAAMLSIDARFPALSALIALLLLAVFLGLLLQTPPVHRMVAAGMAWLGDRFPFSRLLHGFELELMGLGKSPIEVALVAILGVEVLAFVIEELSDGRCVVFVPGAPNPSIGGVYVVPRNCVHLLDAMHYQVASCVSNWGAGTKKLLERARASA